MGYFISSGSCGDAAIDSRFDEIGCGHIHEKTAAEKAADAQWETVRLWEKEQEAAEAAWKSAWQHAAWFRESQEHEREEADRIASGEEKVYWSFDQ